MTAHRSGGPDRRQFVSLGLGAFVVSMLPLGIARRERLIRRTMPVMGTLAELTVVLGDERRAHLALDAAMNELRRVEGLMTRFNATSDVGRANAAAATAPEVVSRETAMVLAEALAWAELTEGRFDPAIGSAVALWDVGRRSAPPPLEELEHLAARKLFRCVEVENRAGHSSVRYHDPAVHVDLGAIGKGYAVDRAAAVLRRCGVTRGLVNVGGDLAAIGSSQSGEPWHIGIQDPKDDRRVDASLRLENRAVATSGTYRQFFRWRGHRYHHLIDPQTASPIATAAESFTIVADSCMHADVAATALFGCGPDESHRVLTKRAPGAVVAHVA